MKRQLSLSLFVLTLSGSINLVQADWVDKRKIERVRAYATESTYNLQVWFNDSVSSECDFSNRAGLSTSDPVALENIRAIALAASLSHREVEVSTKDVCIRGAHGSIGELEYISIRQ